MATKSKKTKPKTAATVASVAARHGGGGKNTAGTSTARAQSVGAYRRLVDEPRETERAEQKRKSTGRFKDRAAALCRYPVVKNLRQASEVVREATQAVLETARGAALHLWKRYAS